MRYNALHKTEARLLNAARRRFGNYEAALRAAGIAYPPIAPLRHWTEALVLKSLNSLHRADADLRYATVKKYRVPLFEAARYYFGSYPNAIRVARLDYDSIVRRALKAESRHKRAQYKLGEFAKAEGKPSGIKRARSLHSPGNEPSSKRRSGHHRHGNPAWSERPKQARGI
jgi:hypothetical protein